MADDGEAIATLMMLDLLHRKCPGNKYVDIPAVAATQQVYSPAEALN